MVEFLQETLNSRSRRRIVMIGSLVLGLLAILPAADDYIAKSSSQAQLASELEKVRRTVAALPETMQLAQDRLGELARLEAMCVTEENLHLIRGRVVELARNCGCQIRQVRPGQLRERPWKPGDDPFDSSPPPGNAPKVGYFLRTQELAFTLSGKLGNAKEFLKDLAEMGLLANARQLNVSAASAGEKEVTVDLSLTLYDLALRTATPGEAT